MSQALLKDREVSAPVAASNIITPMQMLGSAIERGMPPETIQQLMDMAKSMDAFHARKAFASAIAAAQAEIQPIAKNAKGNNDKTYANFAAVSGGVRDILAKHGLFFRFRTRQDDRIHVTCILEHEAGHYEENTLSGAADTSGSKNAIQAIGSTLTYLQRYSLVQALGLAASDDDDGKAAGSADTGPISQEQREIIQKLIDDTGSDIRRFCAAFGIESVADMPAQMFPRATTMLTAKKKGKS